MPVYIFLDTNIYIRHLMQGKPETLQELTQLVDSDQALLLLPQVVVLELDKFRRHLKTKLDLAFKTIADGTGIKWTGGKVLNYVKDVPALLLQALDEHKRQWDENKRQWLKQRKKDTYATAERHYQQIESLFRSQSVVTIPLTPTILFRGKQRLMAGKMPYLDDEPNRENDACIVESLHAHFETAGKDGALYFCSENVKDFGHGDKASAFLDRAIKEGLPAHSPFFTELAALIASVKTPTAIKEPTSEEEQKIIEKEQKEAIEQLAAAEQWAQTLAPIAAMRRPHRYATAYQWNPAHYQTGDNFPWGALSLNVQPFPAGVLPLEDELAFPAPPPNPDKPEPPTTPANDNTTR